ncbi:MAG: SAM-dependent chlorinase/fluorinase [Chitinophagales bacterium]|nr:SAM-dependent chlorinase/fluorinase [Chitinophagales bacterium]
MPVITLTTDLGTRDHYTGTVKGELMKAIPNVQIVDISNEIEPFNIMHGAFVLKNSYHHFPKGTCHLIGVNTLNEEGMSFLVVLNEGFIFIGPDNGFFGLMWEELPSTIFRIREDAAEMFSTLPIKDVFVLAAKHLLAGGDPEEIADKISTYRQSALGRPMINNNFIRCSIIYFDRFENAILNLTREEFEKAAHNRKFVVHFKRFDDIDAVSENYYSVPESEKLILFNSAGYLEIAINKGNAKGLLNLSVGDLVQIEFKG